MTLQFNPKSGGRGIEWTDRTQNPIGGCRHGCEWTMPDGSRAVCYAKTVAERVAQAAYPQGFEAHYWRLHILEEMKAGAEPELRFIDSMSDLLGHWVPEDQVRAVLAAMREAPQHAFQSLTKAAPQILKYMDELPPNLWVGVSSPPDRFMGRDLTRRQQVAILARGLDVLAEVRERTRCLVWMSGEPVSWDLTQVLNRDHPLDWCVVGAASNGRRCYQPNAEHVRRLLRVLDTSGTPVFFKGNLRPLIEARPELGRWREDFPRRYRDGSRIPAVDRREDRCRQFGWTLPREDGS